MSRRHELQDGTGVLWKVPGIGIMAIISTTAPTASAAGYGPGCIYIDRDASAGAIFHVNTGTASSATWLALA